MTEWLSRHDFLGVWGTAFRPVLIASRGLSGDARLGYRRVGLAEDEHVLVRDDLGALAKGARPSSVQHLPERWPHHKLAVTDRGE